MPRFRRKAAKKPKQRRIQASQRLLKTATTAAFNTYNIIDAGHPKEEFRRKRKLYLRLLGVFIADAEEGKRVSAARANYILQIAQTILKAAKP